MEKAAFEQDFCGERTCMTFVDSVGGFVFASTDTRDAAQNDMVLETLATALPKYTQAFGACCSYCITKSRPGR